MLTGSKFGRWTVVEYLGSVNGHGSCLCLCSCGNKRIVRKHKLLSGKSESCGCKRDDELTIHGLARRNKVAPELYIRNAMITRCYSQNSRQYPDYGGRGINVCARWRDSFTNFYEDMGPRPSEKHSLDRKDNDGDYEPSNCRWTTRVVQNSNKRNNHNLTIDGRTDHLQAWSRLSGLCHATIIYRIRKGWTPKQAVFTSRRGNRLEA